MLGFLYRKIIYILLLLSVFSSMTFADSSNIKKIKFIKKGYGAEVIDIVPIDNNGSFLMSWQYWDYQGEPDYHMLQTFDNNGNKISKPIKATGGTTEGPYLPRVISNVSREEFIIGYNEYDGMNIQRFKKNGDKIGKAERIVHSKKDSNTAYLNLDSLSKTGDFIACFQDEIGRYSYIQKFDATNSTKYDITKIKNFYPYNCNFVGDNGDFIITGHNYNGNYTIIQRFDRYGSMIGDEITIYGNFYDLHILALKDNFLLFDTDIIKIFSNKANHLKTIKKGAMFIISAQEGKHFVTANVSSNNELSIQKFNQYGESSSEKIRFQNIKNISSPVGNKIKLATHKADIETIFYVPRNDNIMILENGQGSWTTELFLTKMDMNSSQMPNVKLNENIEEDNAMNDVDYSSLLNVNSWKIERE